MSTTPATAPAAPAQTKTLTPFEEVRKALLSDEMKSQLVMALPPQMNPEKFQRVAITAVNKNPDLLRADRAGLYGAFVLAAQDGLLPDGREGAIVMFGSVPQWMPMVGGVLKKIRNSGELKSITAQEIYKNDKFRYWVDDDGEHLEHEPELFIERGELLGVYALAKTKDDAVYVEVMPKAQVDKVREIAKAKNGPAWTQWYDQMAKKTVIRRLSKRLPMSTDAEDVLRREDDLIDTEARVVGEESKPSEVKGKGPSRLSKMLAEQPVIDMPTGEASPSDETTVIENPKSGKEPGAKK